MYTLYIVILKALCIQEPDCLKRLLWKDNLTFNFYYNFCLPSGEIQVDHQGYNNIVARFLISTHL